MPVLTVPAAIDAFVSEYYPNKNFVFADHEALFFGRFAKPGDTFRSLLKFDIAELSSYYPALDIKSAYLQVYICRNDIPSGTVEAEIYRLTNEWSHTLLTWNSQPFAHPNPEQSFFVPAQWDGLMMVELTSMVKGWFNGDWPNYGLMIKGNEDQDSIVGIGSSHYDDPTARPQLKILFETVEPIDRNPKVR